MTLHEAFIESKGIPTGTGDCCAPKLLNFAAQNNLRPLGISEFFWGRENKSGNIITPFSILLQRKCRPILGLCCVDSIEATDNTAPNKVNASRHESTRYNQELADRNPLPGPGYRGYR